MLRRVEQTTGLSKWDVRYQSESLDRTILLTHRYCTFRGVGVSFHIT